MQNKKQLLNEIHRMREMMNLPKKQILKEDGITKTVKETLEGLLKNIVRKADNEIAQNVIIKWGGEEMSVVRAELDSVIRHLASDTPLTLAGKKLLGDLISKQSDIVDELYTSITKVAMDADGISEETLLRRLMKKSQDEGKGIEQCLTELFGQGSEAEARALTQKYAKKIATIKAKKFTPEIKTKTEPIVDPRTNDPVITPNPISPEKLKAAKADMGLIMKGIMSVSEYLKKYESLWIGYQRKRIANLASTGWEFWKNSQKQNLDRAELLIKEAYVLQSQNQMPAALGKVSEAIQWILISRKNAKDGVQEQLNKFVYENPFFIETGLLDQLKNPKVFKQGEDLQKLVDASTISEIDAYRETLNEGIRKYINVLNPFGLIKTQATIDSIGEEAAKRGWNRFKHWSSQAGWFILWKSPIGLGDLMILATKRGINAQWKAKFAGWVAANFLLIPAISSIAGTIYEQVKSNALASLYDEVLKVCDVEGIIDEQTCLEIYEKRENLKFAFLETYMKNFIGAMPVNFTDNVEGDNWLNENYFFMTYLDEVLNTGYDLLKTTKLSPTGAEELTTKEEFEEKLKAAVSEKLQDKLTEEEKTDPQKIIKKFTEIFINKGLNFRERRTWVQLAKDKRKQELKNKQDETGQEIVYVHTPDNTGFVDWVNDNKYKKTADFDKEVGIGYISYKNRDNQLVKNHDCKFEDKDHDLIVVFNEDMGDFEIVPIRGDNPFK